MKYIIADAKKQNGIILMSSHEEYAVEAFEWESDGFLLLPVSKDKIKRLLLRFWKIEDLKKLQGIENRGD